MGRSCLQAIFLVTALLLILCSHGSGRKLMETLDDGEYSTVLSEENGVESREMIELDYVDAGPNTNTKSGFQFAPPPQPRTTKG